MLMWQLFLFWTQKTTSKIGASWTKIRLENSFYPHLSKGKRGKSLCEKQQMHLIEAIFYRLKTGCQWRELPVEKYFNEPYSYQSVFYHFNRWCKDGT